MREWVVVIFITGVFLSSITTSQASVDGINLADYPRNSILYQSIKKEQSVKQLNKIIVLPKQSFDQREAAAMITRIAALPSFLLEKVKQHGITVNPTAQQLAGKVPRGYQANVTWDGVPGIGGSKVVLAQIGSSEKGKGHGSVNLELHELAHSIDRFVFDDISGTKEFQSVWEIEHEHLFPGNHYFDYPEEYFAEAFAMFYLNKDTKEQLLLDAPLTFNFIKKLH